MTTLTDLQPSAVWKHFAAICGIPHPSGHEEQFARYVVDVAERCGHRVARDATGNVVVTQAASPGCEDAPTVILQGHLDMVPVAIPGRDMDFTKDPIRAFVDGDYVRADGTTLGADNGIAGAMMLAIMAAEGRRHPRLEHLFTVSEETGMDGAHGLDASLLTGRRLINLDTEEFGEIYVSCAGGADSAVRLPIERAPADADTVTMELRIGGLQGGHSGLDIKRRRGNAIRLLGRTLRVAADTAALRLRHLEGGAKRNAIAEQATARFDLPAGEVDKVAHAVEQLRGDLTTELRGPDPDFTMQLAHAGSGSGSDSEQPLTGSSTTDVIDLLVALPDGVLAMSPAIEGLVETSCNLGTLSCGDHSLDLCVLTRSAVDSAVAMVQDRIRTIARRCGGRTEEPPGYPGWQPNPDSELLQIASAVHERLFGEKPAIKAVHAGLECGLLGEKLPGADMISMGPTMSDVHTPSEQLYIPHVAETERLLWALLDELAGK